MGCSSPKHRAVKLLSLAKRFNILLPDFATGTILNVKQLADSWNEESLRHLFISLQDLIPPFDIPSFLQYLYVAGDDNYGKVEAKYYDDFDYKVSAKCNEDGLFVDVQRNELDINALRSEYRGLFELDDMKRFPYRLEDFEQESYQMHLELNELLECEIQSCWKSMLQNLALSVLIFIS